MNLIKSFRVIFTAYSFFFIKSIMRCVGCVDSYSCIFARSCARSIRTTFYFTSSLSTLFISFLSSRSSNLLLSVNCSDPQVPRENSKALGKSKKPRGKRKMFAAKQKKVTAKKKLTAKEKCSRQKKNTHEKKKNQVTVK